MIAVRTDIVDSIMRYEDGELSDRETVDLFATLFNTGYLQGLQGHYTRGMVALVDAGLIVFDESTGEAVSNYVERED